MHYKATYAYYRLIEFIDDYKDDSDWDLQLRALYYREFKEWFDINNAVNGIMYFYTYAAAGYSALSYRKKEQLIFHLSLTPGCKVPVSF